MRSLTNLQKLRLERRHYECFCISLNMCGTLRLDFLLPFLTGDGFSVDEDVFCDINVC